jgi:hypothetical protein
LAYSNESFLVESVNNLGWFHEVAGELGVVHVYMIIEHIELLHLGSNDLWGKHLAEEFETVSRDFHACVIINVDLVESS